MHFTFTLTQESIHAKIDRNKIVCLGLKYVQQNFENSYGGIFFSPQTSEILRGIQLCNFELSAF